MTLDFSAATVPDKGSAIAAHGRLRVGGASILHLGWFYMAMLERALWPTQATMASDLQVSASNVSRSMAAARLPRELVDAAGGEARMTFSVADTFDFLVSRLGAAVVTERAQKLPPGLSVKEIEHALVTGVSPRSDQIRVSISANRKHLIVESDELSSVLRNTPDIVHVINAILGTR
ncbi:hypothetical protein [Burkholderia gladioli]|uniref:hypothetical protein n=1 Tax=Burkholderia gladioli TaxID=28095 RepID=UPI00163FEC3F|nr:hypothetical protein [Burkholderia gladioli]